MNIGIIHPMINNGKSTLSLKIWIKGILLNDYKVFYRVCSKVHIFSEYDALRIEIFSCKVLWETFLSLNAEKRKRPFHNNLSVKQTLPLYYWSLEYKIAQGLPYNTKLTIVSVLFSILADSVWEKESEFWQHLYRFVSLFAN